MTNPLGCLPQPRLRQSWSSYGELGKRAPVAGVGLSTRSLLGDRKG